MAMDGQSLEKTTKVSRPWFSLLWYVLTLAAGVGVGIFIRGVAGVWGRLVLSHKPLFFAIAPAIIQVIAGAIAGFIALWQFNRTYQQRERHSERTHQEALDTLLQTQFEDIQDRLASPEPIIRANAALRLAQFGTTLAPNANAGAPRTEANNPYFVPAASQLATALYLEPRQEIRKAVREAIKNLIEFGKGDKDKDETVAEEQPLLHALIERLADANRSAKDNFIRTLAEYTVYGVGSELDLTFVASLAPFCDKAELTRSCLEALMAEGEVNHDTGEVTGEGAYSVQVRTFQETRLKQKADEIDKTTAGTIPALLTAAQQAIDTRDALAEALRELAAPGDLPQNKEDGSLDLQALGGWERSPEFSLKGCLLSGTGLKAAQLQGAILIQTHLQGSSLRSAWLQNATLSRAQLQGTDLAWAHLENTNIAYAHLQGAILAMAKLQGADLLRAQLLETKLYGVYIQREVTVDLWHTNLPEDTLSVADFEPHGYQSNDYPDVRTEELKEWLRELYPPPAEEKKQAKRGKKTPAGEAEG